ncbi:MAG: endonuclease/exonuclease/phosphatase family protein [Tannerella sp.]|nr:endonuclease/exonuclease/phosphatase family protein [Tannerella sp.]
MKGNLLCLIALFSGACGFHGNAQEKATLRVATYNLRLDTESDGENAWPNRQETVNGLVRFHDFDIFGTQEGFKHQLDALVQAGDYAYIGGGRDDGKDAGEHSAILYKKDRFEVLEHGNFWYSETPDVPGKGWDATCCNRICSWGKFHDKPSGKVFYFFNSHFDHQGKVARRESSKLLLSRIKSIAAGFPVFVTGDFNARPDDEPIQIIVTDGFLKDSYVLTETKPYGTTGTFQGFRPDAQPRNRIDYIFVTDGIRILKYGVLTDRPYGRYPSDHYPVMVVASF